MESLSASRKLSQPQRQLKQEGLKPTAKREQVLVACAICRQKKTKVGAHPNTYTRRSLTDQCDAVRPSCGPCLVLQRDCHYEAEPGATRSLSLKRRHDAVQTDLSNMRRLYEALRDSSPTEAANLLQQIRRSLDPSDILQDLPSTSSQVAVVPPRKRINTQGTTPSHYGSPASVDSSFMGLDLNPPPQIERSKQKPYPHLSVSHKVLLWPGVFRHIWKSGSTEAISELQYVGTLGTPWLLEKHTSRHLQSLSCDSNLKSRALGNGLVIFPSLTIQRTGEYTAAYFSTFNTIFPLLIRDDFKDNVVAKVLLHGYAYDDPGSVLALFVFALGRLATECDPDHPAGASNGTPGILRGSVSERPFSLDIFNEARRRGGLIATRRCLLNIQIMLLQATYFEACARHADFWSSVSAASMTCRYLIRGQKMDWTSEEGDLVKRAYWVCLLHERLLDIDLKIACTGIEEMEDQVPLPHFHESMPKAERLKSPRSGASRTVGEAEEHDYAYHFTALVTLSRLLRRADALVHGCEHYVDENEPIWQEGKGQDHSDDTVDVTDATKYIDPPCQVIEELSVQLQSWRTALPPRLQWNDSDRFEFKRVKGSSQVSPQETTWTHMSPIGPERSSHDIDMAVAHLRIRFYHAQFLINRPFIYKALHVPELTTADDRIKCGIAIKRLASGRSFSRRPLIKNISSRTYSPGRRTSWQCYVYCACVSVIAC